MDFLRQLIIVNDESNKDNNKHTINYVDKNNHIKNLEEQINNLIDISIWHLPNNKQEVLEQQNQILKCLISIISSLYDILMNNLKINKGVKKEAHFWDYISKFFQITSVKFIINVYDSLNTDHHRGLAWLSLSVFENSFYDNIKEIYKQEFDKYK